jgi:hypothetical protein
LDERVDTNPTEFLVETAVLVGLLIFICYKKGEKPRWQWGPPDPDKNKDKMEG